MAAAVVEFDSLSDSVRTTAQNHNLFLVVCSHGSVFFCIIGGIVIAGIFNTAYRHPKPGFFYAQFVAAAADILFCNLENFGKILVAESVFFCLDKQAVFRHASWIFEHFFFKVNHFLHFFEEIFFYVSNF